MTLARFSVAAYDVPTMHNIAAALARECRISDCILLRGDLGAGKTTFARGFIQELFPRQRTIVSPTFSLVQTYTAARTPTVWHFDLYRLHDEEEVTEIGLEEAMRTGITLIEWPEMAESVLHGNTLDVTISMSPDTSMRRIEFAGSESAWQSKLAALGNWNAHG